jgi:hypothetical protein
MAAGFQLSPEELIAKINTPEFPTTLRDILASVKLADLPAPIDQRTGVQIGAGLPFVLFAGVTLARDVTLPTALACSKTAQSFACTWETKPNKYSVAVLQEGLSAVVSAVLPGTWRREKGEDWEMGYGVGYGERYTAFIDTGGKIAITTSCPIWVDDAHYDSFTATLTIERNERRQERLRYKAQKSVR